MSNSRAKGLMKHSQGSSLLGERRVNQRSEDRLCPRQGTEIVQLDGVLCVMPFLPLFFFSFFFSSTPLWTFIVFEFIFLLSSQITFSTYTLLQASVKRRGADCGRRDSSFRLVTKIILLWLTVLRPKRARIQFHRSFLIAHYNLSFIGCIVFMFFCQLPNPIHGAESSCAIDSVGQDVFRLREPV